MHARPQVAGRLPGARGEARGADDVLCEICAGQIVDAHTPLILPAPLAVPPLTGCAAELGRIIAEYASDAIADLAAPASSFTADDHA